MTRDEAISRIQKLLARSVANGATEAEAATAAVMAQKVMDEYNLSGDDVTGPNPSAISFRAVWSGPREDVFFGVASTAVKHLFPVAAVMVQTIHPNGSSVFELRLFGDSVNLEAAAWAVDFLATSFKTCWVRYMARTGAGKSKMLGYLGGLVAGVVGRAETQRVMLEATRPGVRNALALRTNAAQEAMQATHPGSQIRLAVTDRDIFHDGVRDGKQISVARSIGPADRVKLSK